jgi:REP element-mobilizing transposase RayT
MATTEHYYTKFEAGNFYHVYNRSVDKKPMFKNDDNYRFFLKQYDHYLSVVADTYAYCLLGNHFHFLLRIPDVARGENQRENEAEAHKIVSHQFRKLFQSYAMAFNKQQDRTGTLFQTPFKRAIVDKETYFTQLVYYIHANPQTHGLIDEFRNWKWSSYSTMLTEKPTKLKRQEVINWFGTTNAYREFHSINQKMNHDAKYFLEDQRYPDLTTF